MTVKGANWLPAGKFGILVFIIAVFIFGSSWPFAILASLATSRAIILINESYGDEVPSLRTRVRRSSFLTDLMLKGTFPSKFKIPEAVITGILYFDQLPQSDILWHRLQTTLFVDPQMERFRSVGSSTGVWTPKQPFAMSRAYHIKEGLSVSSEEELTKFAQVLLDKPFDKNEPLWDMHFVQNTNGRSGVIPRFAHALGDGISLVQLFLKVLSDKDGSPVPLPSFIRAAAPRGSPSSTAKNESKNKRVTPSAMAQAKTFVTSVAGAIAKVAMLPAGKDDTKTAIRDTARPFKWTNARTLVLAPTIPLSQVKTIKDAAGATVNDVMVAALAGAIRRYLEYRGESPEILDKVSIRAMVPYAFPRPLRGDDDTGLRNQWCFISMSLPVDMSIPSSFQRLTESKRRCDALKSSPEAAIQYGIQAAMAHVLPFSVQASTALDIMLKHSLVFSNVPGPDQVVYFAGQPLLDFYAMVTNIVPQILAISYNGHISLSITVDEAIISEPSKLTDAFIAELASLEAAATATAADKSS